MGGRGWGKVKGGFEIRRGVVFTMSDLGVPCSKGRKGETSGGGIHRHMGQNSGKKNN